ncbi:hypothetical protein RFEPED_0288 [Rickettsia felis str. Pedreira]|uniref:Uncharacterized protein n=1 Tax=Rickettsia felis str. Pedreira TaxID=1359196 RepID=A0A0F3MR35_RICFI|nr:hypothetical protein [Rickettsia felis]KJV57917.1 hypothetical protein RFEPED_0288 [Rickettsia felis str. Pedreira]MDE8611999.1 hypothetical protein [Rickettsia felis]
MALYVLKNNTQVETIIIYGASLIARRCPRGSISPLLSRGLTYSTGQFSLYVIPAEAGIQNKAR